jgi:hypothetical protein
MRISPECPATSGLMSRHYGTDGEKGKRWTIAAAIRQGRFGDRRIH